MAAHVPEITSSRRFTLSAALYRSQFVVPVKFSASVIEAHVHRRVVGMTVGSYYGADLPFPRPLSSIQHCHRGTDMCLMRFQDVRPFVGRFLGPDPNSSPKKRFPFLTQVL